jgi:hypothetical protein
VVLDEIGGPAAVLCPASGQLKFEKKSFLGSLTVVTLPCAAGSVVDTRQVYEGGSALGVGVQPWVLCPSSGELQVNYHGSDPVPLDGSGGGWVIRTCAPGSKEELNQEP